MVNFFNHALRRFVSHSKLTGYGMSNGKHVLFRAIAAAVPLAAFAPAMTTAQDLSTTEQQADMIGMDRADGEPSAPLDAQPDLLQNEPLAQAPPANADTLAGLSVRSVALEGAEPLDYDIFADMLADYSGRELDQDELADLTRQLADLARNEGYVFATAYVPEQAVTLGILRVILDVGRIDAVRLVGSDNQSARALLAPLIGTIATRETLERQLLLASDIPGVYLRSPRLEREDGQNVLIVEAGDHRDRGKITFDNYGTENFGPIRVKSETDFYTVLTDSDHLELSARTNPGNPGEFLFSAFEYSAGLGTSGARVGVAGSLGEVGSSYRGGTLDGNTLFAGIRGRYPLTRSRKGGLWVELAAEHLKVQRDFGGQPIGRDITTTLAVGLDGRVSLLGGWLFTSARFVQGVDALGATREGDPGASRRDGDGVFSKAELFGRWRGAVADELELTLSARGQVASRSLLATQDLGLGGPYSVRGYDFSELSGDDGFYTLAELSYGWDDPARWLDRLELYAFVDGGYVHDRNNGGRGGGLASAGPGIRVETGAFSLEAETAVPISRDRDASADRSPHLNVRAGIGF